MVPGQVFDEKSFNPNLIAKWMEQGRLDYRCSSEKIDGGTLIWRMKIKLKDILIDLDVLDQLYLFIQYASIGITSGMYTPPLFTGRKKEIGTTASRTFLESTKSPLFKNKLKVATQPANNKLMNFNPENYRAWPYWISLTIEGCSMSKPGTLYLPTPLVLMGFHVENSIIVGLKVQPYHPSYCDNLINFSFTSSIASIEIANHVLPITSKTDQVLNIINSKVVLNLDKSNILQDACLWHIHNSLYPSTGQCFHSRFVKEKEIPASLYSTVVRHLDENLIYRYTRQVSDRPGPFKKTKEAKAFLAEFQSTAPRMEKEYRPVNFVTLYVHGTGKNLIPMLEPYIGRLIHNFVITDIINTDEYCLSASGMRNFDNSSNCNKCHRLTLNVESSSIGLQSRNWSTHLEGSFKMGNDAVANAVPHLFYTNEVTSSIFRDLGIEEKEESKDIHVLCSGYPHNTDLTGNLYDPLGETEKRSLRLGNLVYDNTLGIVQAENITTICLH